MPMVLVLLLAALFAIGLRQLAVPVSPARLHRYIASHSLDPSSSNRSRLWDYLAARRRARVAGLLVAAGIGLLGSIPHHRVELQVVPLLIGWLAGAVAVEVVQRSGGVRATTAVPLAYWWRGAPVVTAVIAVLWTVAAVLLRSDGVPYPMLLGWGAGALATAVVVLGALRLVRRNGLRGLDPADAELDSAAAVDAARGLTVGGTALAMLCLASVWIVAVPGPYAAAPELYPVVSLVAIAAVVLAMYTAPPSAGSKERLGRKLFAYAVVAALPLAWAVPVRLAQEPPFSAQEARANAQIRFARLDRIPEAQAELGLKPDPPAGLPAGDPSLPTELVGRVDLARPAPKGTYYQLFAFDRRNNSAVTVYGAHGGSWYGAWTRVLPARYSWLSQVIGVRDAQGFTHDPMAASVDRESGLLWFRTAFLDERGISPGDLQLVLMLVRDRGSYIYWATTIPSTTSTLG